MMAVAPAVFQSERIRRNYAPFALTLLCLMRCEVDMATGQFWDMPIETGEIPPSKTEFDCIVVGGGPGGAGGEQVKQ